MCIFSQILYYFLTCLPFALLKLILSDLLTYVLLVGLVDVLTFNLCPTYAPALVGLVPFFRRPGDPKITGIYKPEIPRYIQHTVKLQETTRYSTSHC